MTTFHADAARRLLAGLPSPLHTWDAGDVQPAVAVHPGTREVIVAAANVMLESAFDGAWIAGIPNSRNCSGFLKSAGQAFGANVPQGSADAIIEELERASRDPRGAWVKAGVGHAGLEEAVRLAFSGSLVVAAATSGDYGDTNGHVAILLPKLSGPHKAPLIYGGGSTAARSKGTKTIRQVWNPLRHDVLRFFAHRTVLLGEFE